jgi:hypothetical protein
MSHKGQQHHLGVGQSLPVNAGKRTNSDAARTSHSGHVQTLALQGAIAVDVSDLSKMFKGSYLNGEEI